MVTLSIFATHTSNAVYAVLDIWLLEILILMVTSSPSIFCGHIVDMSAEQKTKNCYHPILNNGGERKLVNINYKQFYYV